MPNASGSVNIADNTNKKVDITEEEWKKFKEAMKNVEFRKYLAEYAQELMDPAKRQVYEQELEQLERERGFDITWIHPSAGYVIKLLDVDGVKCFINICSNDNVAVASSQPASQGGSHGVRWSLPYCQSPPVRDCDKNGALCTVCDVVFHHQTLHIAAGDVRIKRLLEETAIAAVMDSFNIKLNKDRIKYPSIKYKGMKRPSVLRRPRSNVVPPENGDGVTAMSELIQKKLCLDGSTARRPVYSITYREHPAIADTAAAVPGGTASVGAAAREMVVRVHMPDVRSASELQLEVNERQLQLSGAGYHLELKLPQRINEDEGGATFDSSSRSMTIVLPLLVSSVSGGGGGAVMRRDSGVATDDEDGDDNDEQAIGGKPCTDKRTCIPYKTASNSDNNSVSSDSFSGVLSGDHDSMENDVMTSREANTHNTDNSTNMDISDCSDGQIKGVTLSSADNIDTSATRLYKLPSYRLYQDSLHVVLSLTQPCLLADTLSVEADGCRFSLTVESMGAGCVRFYYRLVALFNSRLGKASSVRSQDCLIVRLLKLSSGDNTLTCCIGLDDASLESIVIPFRTENCTDSVRPSYSGVKSILKKSCSSDSSLEELCVCSQPASADNHWLLSGEEDEDADEYDENEVDGHAQGDKKTVRFCSHVLEKRYRSDSSIVQEASRMARRRAKKRRQRQRHCSDGEAASETDDNASSESGTKPQSSQRHCPIVGRRIVPAVAVAASSSDITDISDADSSGGGSATTSTQPMTKKRRRNMRKRERRHKNQLNNHLIFDLDA